MVQDSAWFGTAHSKGVAEGADGHGCPVPLQKKKAADAAVDWMYVYPIWTITDWVLDVKKKALSQFALTQCLKEFKMAN